MERLMTYTRDGVPQGLRSREEVHILGLWHRVIHVWVITPGERGGRLWFQQRSWEKQEFPGLFELTVTGHLNGEENPLSAALRETREEIGLSLLPQELEYLGDTWEDARWQQRLDREWCSVYLCRREIPDFIPGEEVRQMVWVPVADFARKERGLDALTLARSTNGTSCSIPAKGWCAHPGEFETFVLPALKEPL